MFLRLLPCTFSLLAISSALCVGQTVDTVIPHNQSQLPGPALEPEEAVRRMSVPEGFSVELVASEPQIANPVAMTIDERGRFWITESFEYPRRSPGPGRDRVKVLEDTDHDGRVDKVQVFAEGLNIPSGIAVGHGGVWVANSPDILFMQDTDGDGRADRREVVVTGFGRDDTHELPNSLTWGPDGWLYGLNGVFNHSHVQHRGKEFDFTCALFRIHPRTREFQLFAEGTSNPWGVAFDVEGSAFVSACVIDHLWHLTESGYYHRQGGPYPPHTWKLDSIVDYKHQMAAYCGITYFDSDAYPPEYREKLYMGNIHGNCINVDALSRNGSTYAGRPLPDFLSANDVWFMPVVQKTGPDGCLYVLDWYDRYHCYQDANRDPEGIDRGRGRLYRVRYQQTPRAASFDLAQQTNAQLIESLGDANIYVRETAQRLLAERQDDANQAPLQRIVLDDSRPLKQRRHALWTLISTGDLEVEFHQQLLRSADPTFRAWAVRAAGNQGQVDPAVRQLVESLANDSSADVRLQVAIAARKLTGAPAIDLLLKVLANSSDDPIIPSIVWQNLHPLLETSADRLAAAAAALPSTARTELMPRTFRRLMDVSPLPVATISDLLRQEIGRAADDPDTSRQCLRSLTDSLSERAVTADELQSLQPITATVKRAGLDPSFSIRNEALLLAAVLRDRESLDQLARLTTDNAESTTLRQQALRILSAQDDSRLIESARAMLNDNSRDLEFQAEVIATLGQSSREEIADMLLSRWNDLPDALRPRVVELLTQRPAWAIPLLLRIQAQEMAKEVVHVNQARRLAASTNPEIQALTKEIWGTIREGRNPQSEQIITGIAQRFASSTGDVVRGQAVFEKTCAQCHQLHGKGETVGPDITRNGRASFEQLLSNVFDPNLVIGSGYQAEIVITHDGRSLSGLLVEESPERVVLKLQGGKIETIPRQEIEERTTSPLSLMPEDWDKQIPPDELIDLLEYITCEQPPDDNDAPRIPGTPRESAAGQ